MTISIDIPGFNRLRLEHIVLDYNGTIAVDGVLLPGVVSRLRRLSKQVTLHVLTADTFGFAAESLKGLPLCLKILPKGRQNQAKNAYVKKLGFQSCACIGNGRNDRLMLKNAGLGIAVMHAEGVAVQSLQAADVFCAHIHEALDLFQNPKRLIATLRS